MDDQGAADLSDYVGLNLIDFKILPHIDHPRYGPKARAIASQIKSSEPVIGRRDDQAVYVRDNYIEIYR